MADPWAKYTKDPNAPKPERDWSKASWGDVAAQAAMNVVPTYLEDMWQAVKGIPGQAQDVARAMVDPAHASPISRLMASVVMPSYTMGRDIAHPGEGEQRMRDALRIAQGLQHHVASHYTDPGALKRTLATDPGGALMDLQAVASAGEGAGAVASRLPGLAGRAAGAASRGAKMFNEATNPVSLAGRGVTTGARSLQRAVRGGSPLTKAGEFTPAALKAVEDAFPNGQITDAELSNPRFKQVLADTFRTKGISPEAVKEAVLKYHGAPTPTSIVSRTKPSKTVAGAVQEAAEDARRAIAQKVQAISGAPEPDSSELGSALHRASQQSDRNVSRLYDQASKLPGTFHPVFKDILGENLQKALEAENLPSTPEEMAKFPSHKLSREAYDFLTGHISDLAEQNGLTFPAVERARQELNALWKGAKGNDSFAISTMKGALDQSIADILTHSVPEGAPVDFTPEDFARAREASALHRAQFENRSTANPSIVSALKKTEGPSVDLEGSPIEPDLATGSAAQGVLSKALLGSKGLVVQPGAPKLYADLSAVLDDPGREALANHVRRSILRVGDNGYLAAQPGQIRDFLDSPMGQLFTPEEQSELRLSAAGHDILNARPPITSVPPEGGSFGPAVRRGLGMAAAGVGAYFSPLHAAAPGVAELGSAILGGEIERQLEPILQGHQIKRELSGVPAVGASLDTPAALGKGVSRTARALPVLRALQETREQTPKALEPVQVIPEDLSTVPGPFERPEAPERIVPEKGDPWASYLAAPDTTEAPPDDLSMASGPFEEGRAGHASGGKVDDIEPLVDRLMKLAKDAKRQADSATKPLLSVPDAAVAKALAIAQRSI